MQKHSGFTLMELMITIAIISIMAAIAVPGFIGWLPKYRLGNAARDILSVVEKARMEAVKRNTSVGLAFNTGSDSYTLWIDDGAGGGTADDAAQNGTESTVGAGQLAAGIDMTAAIFGANPQFRFNGMGIPIRTDTLPGGGTVTVINQLGDSRTITVSKGGNSSIQ